MNSRVSRAAGTAVTASISTQHDSSRSTPVACGEFSRWVICGAATITPAHITTLQSSDRVATVGAIRPTSPGQRTTARLTPSSLTLSSALIATRATA